MTDLPAALLRTTITGIRRATETRPAACECVTLGRACLGLHVWFLLEDSRHPMNLHLRAAWARAVQRNAKRAISDYAEIRGEAVDAAEIMSNLNQAHQMREDGEN